MTDKKILKAIRELRASGLKSVSAQSIMLKTGLPKQRVYKRLNNLEKYGFIKKKGKKTVNFWDIT